MDSSKALKYHFATFTVAGFWPVEWLHFGPFHKYWILFVYLFLGVLFPLSQVCNLFFANSISKMVDGSAITSSVVIVVFKAYNLYAKQTELREFFEQLKELDLDIQHSSHTIQLNSAIKLGHRLYFIYLFPYISAIALLILQAIYSPPEIRLWASTYAYPFDWAQQTYVYLIGLVLQGFANTCIVIFAVAADTYGVIAIHIVTTHIDILQNRLTEVGDDKNLNEREHFDQLIGCCKTYENILRCSQLLEYSLGPALFAQFGVSGIVLCTSAYQLSVMTPDDFSKLPFVIVYFMCMLTEIFVPCYFGSVALEKSNVMCWKMYESNWIEQSKQYKQAFRMFVTRTIKPIHLVAYKVFLLDLSTFLRILKTAYSLFALLKNV